jgi:hypothetical protein
MSASAARSAVTQKEIIDDALDLINYTMFFIINLRAGREGSPTSGL